MNRRQFIRNSALVLSAPALLNLVACSKGGETAGSAEFDGNFILGFDQDFPPYGYLADDGSYTGFDIELAEKVCDMEGWTFVPTPISWDAKDGLLKSGQITCIWNGFTVEGRENDYTFTDPYMENRQVIVVRADSGIKSLADLAGKNVITQADSAAYDLLNEDGDQASLGASFNELQTIGEYHTAFMMLENTSVDAVAVDYPVAVFNIGDKADTFTILDESLNSEHFAVGFDTTEMGKQLAATVEADLQKLDADGAVEALCDKYADQGVSYDLWVLPTA